MALDFVLAHPEGEFLVTEQETVSYFLETQRIDPDLLPARSYCIKGRHLTRHFADGFPVFLRDDQPYSVSFCYIDDSEFSLAAFRSYLVQYRPLFKALGGAPSLYFVTQQQTRFEAARKMIRRFSDRLGEAEPVVDINRLLAHFPHRLLWERRDIKHLNTAQIHRLQDDLYTFSGPEYDHLFASWKQGGDAAVRSELAAEYDATPLNVRLSVHILEHDYDMLSNPQASSSQTFRMLNAGPTGDCAGQTAWSPT